MDEKSKREVRASLVLILQISINMLVPILACSFIGWWIGGKIDKNFPFIIGFVIGSIAGFNSVYKLIKKYLINRKSPGELAREAQESEKLNKQDKEIK